MYISQDVLRLNVGFIIHQTVGYSRDFPFEIPSLRLPPDLDLIDFTGVVRVTRTAQGLFVQAKLQAMAASECVRCLTEFQQPLEVEFSDLYAFTLSSITEAGLLLPENGKIDLAPIVRDEMLLAFPIKPLCRPDCKGLCPICGENRNEINCHPGDESLQAGPGELSSVFE
ncbi:MAG: hypothetical protein A2W35_09885 [Chloroflexi bacterium RBG_16_57_11]|nr:MAG: hypothetical protein A2W35_09885 [Chloroflexi bacterium RBG_16_57_11]